MNGANLYEFDPFIQPRVGQNCVVYRGFMNGKRQIVMKEYEEPKIRIIDVKNDDLILNSKEKEDIKKL